MFLTLWKNVMRSEFPVNNLGPYEKGFGHAVPSTSKPQRTDRKKTQQEWTGIWPALPHRG